ncbi:hypothetical protein TRICI_000748 [Trichomonascus ciferrii]|uniref:Obg-like ATPase homolog n=1 Tax=Trichomonascus ciferrii TaxID=44093 RepID=A0A642VBZ0_9ASCO|nr:hypothetical protein TRICI_000748 [Trichomonascus ciferrii]
MDDKTKVIVPSKRFDKLCEIYKPSQAQIPASLTVFDIAGLVKGASQGDGLGNSFLSHIRAVDGLFQVVRAFDDQEIIHVEGNVDPVRDLQIIFDELILKDMEFASKTIELAERYMKKSPPNKAKEYKQELETAKKVLAHLEDNKRVINGQWSNAEIDVINSMKLLTAKPSVYLVNVTEEDYVSNSDNQRVKDIKQWVSENSPGDVVMPISISLEERLAILDTEAEKAQELESLSVQSALPSAITELRKSLRLISFFTCGPKEVREWTIRQGVKAPEAAGVIHNDLQKTFIQAQVYKYDDVLVCNGDESSLKSNGKLLQKGKDYVVEDGDIILFKVSSL